MPSSSPDEGRPEGEPDLFPAPLPSRDPFPELWDGVRSPVERDRPEDCSELFELREPLASREERGFALDLVYLSP